MGTTWSQFFPPTPRLTEANLPRQDGKVFIVTGGTSGVGLELCSILYHAGGKVYMAGRSEENAKAAMLKITSMPSSSPGELVFLHISLDDLTTIRPAAERFRQSECRLDVLFNNAGVSHPGQGSTGKQGQELQLATNCLGPFLFTQMLVPILIASAKTARPAAVRVIWLSSIATEFSPSGGIDLMDLQNPPLDQQRNYATSKTGNWFLADALARQVGPDGILSVTLNPGNLRSGLMRHLPWLFTGFVAPLLYEPVMGAYTELWAGLSENLVIEDGGRYIIPWGRFHPNPRWDILNAFKSPEDGGTGVAARFVEYCDEQTRMYR